MKALVIGGTGPTGPHVVEGLLDRGYEVTLFHRGTHEIPEMPDVAHIHGDPHFAHTLQESIGTSQFDVVLAMYGRLELIADFFAHRCRQLVGVTANIVYQNVSDPGSHLPYGPKVMVREDDPLADAMGTPNRFVERVLAAERTIFEHADQGAFQGTIIRYPAIYGPRNVMPYEWSVMKRIRDRRPHMLVTDGGLGITSKCAARNAAHGLLLAVDQPDRAAGEAFNVADEDQFTLRQWIEVVTAIFGGELEIVSIPLEIGMATYVEMNPTPGVMPHTLVNNNKIKNILGYTDAISAVEALRETVAWLAKNPPKAADYPSYLDFFDYDAEDRLVNDYRLAINGIRGSVRSVPERRHSMPHPKTPNQVKDHAGR